MNKADATHPTSSPSLPEITAGVLLWFGGSFDPPTQAHFTLAEHARRAISADRLVYCPAARSPFKDTNPIASGDDRVRMLRLGIEKRLQAASFVSTVELDRSAAGKPSYTIDTLRAVRAALPSPVTLRLLIGADQARSFHLWKDADRLIEIADPVVLRRLQHAEEADNDGRDALLADITRNWPARERTRWQERLIEAPLLDASSTRARGLLAASGGEEPPAGLADLLPPAVLAYAIEQGLYRSPPA